MLFLLAIASNETRDQRLAYEFSVMPPAFAEASRTVPAAQLTSTSWTEGESSSRLGLGTGTCTDTGVSVALTYGVVPRELNSCSSRDIGRWHRTLAHPTWPRSGYGSRCSW